MIFMPTAISGVSSGLLRSSNGTPKAFRKERIDGSTWKRKEVQGLSPKAIISVIGGG